MTREEARASVLSYLNGGRGASSEELVLMDEMTMEKAYGWVFFFNARRFVETRNVLFGLGGNGPVVVERSSGRIACLGTARPPEVEIAEFERRNGLQEDLRPTAGPVKR